MSPADLEREKRARLKAELAELRRPLTPGTTLEPAERQAIASRVREGKRQQSNPRTVRRADACTPNATGLRVLPDEDCG
jgi:hypothetical protein